MNNDWAIPLYRYLDAGALALSGASGYTSERRQRGLQSFVHNFLLPEPEVISGRVPKCSECITHHHSDHRVYANKGNQFLMHEMVNAPR